MKGDKFYSKNFKEVYNKFLSMFQQEGDVYESILETIQEDFESGTIPDNIQKKAIVSILDEAAVEYYFKEHITIFTEKQYLDEFL